MLLVTFHLTKEYTSHLIAGYFPTTKQHDILPRYGLLSHCEEVHKPPRCELLTHYKTACYPTALWVTFPLLKNTLTNAIRIITTHHQKNTPHRVAGYPPLTSRHTTTLRVSLLTLPHPTTLRVAHTILRVIDSHARFTRSEWWFFYLVIAKNCIRWAHW